MFMLPLPRELETPQCPGVVRELERKYRKVQACSVRRHVAQINCHTALRIRSGFRL